MNAWIVLPIYFAGAVPAFYLFRWVGRFTTPKEEWHPTTKGEFRTDLVFAPFWPLQLMSLLAFALFFVALIAPAVGLVELGEWAGRRIRARFRVNEWPITRWFNDPAPMQSRENQKDDTDAPKGLPGDWKS